MSVKCTHCQDDRLSRCSYADCPWEVDSANATISHLQAELDRFREALKKAQDISGSLWHSSSGLSNRHYRELRKVLSAALGGSNDKG